MKNKTLVPGSGNMLLGDEGAGVHAVRALQEKHDDLADVEFLDGGTLSFTLAGPIEEAGSLIVISGRRGVDQGKGQLKKTSMKRGYQATAALTALFLTGTVQAHGLGAHGAGFAAGIAHPFLGLDHLLAMLAVGVVWALVSRWRI